MEEENGIYDIVEKINTRSDFENFLTELKENYKSHREVWENDTLESYLEGLYGYNFKSKDDKPSWKLFAEILLTARVYE